MATKRRDGGLMHRSNFISFEAGLSNPTLVAAQQRKGHRTKSGAHAVADDVADLVDIGA
jgi:hypothetical protein